MPCSEGRIGHGVLRLVVHGHGLLARALVVVVVLLLLLLMMMLVVVVVLLVVVIILGGIASRVPTRDPAGCF